jgi:surface protein
LMRPLSPGDSLGATPGPPTEVTGTSGDSQMAMIWTAPEDPGESEITGYRIEYSSDGGSTWTTFGDTGTTATSATVTGLTNATSYIFRVAAINSGGVGTYSTPSASLAPFVYDSNKLVFVVNTSLTPGTRTAAFTVGAVTGVTPNYTVDWGDGTIQTFTTTGNRSRTYASDGVYVVQISGTLGSLTFATNAIHPRIQRCLSFGSLTGLQTLRLRGTGNLIQVPLTAPPVTSLLEFFRACGSFNQPIGSWDTSAVTNMQAMFRGCGSFNQPIGSWDTSAVTDMQAMFGDPSDIVFSVFNQPLNNWNTSLVTDMSNMFRNCLSFNQPIGSWNTSAVTNMSSMFRRCEAFNQPIGSWNTSAVTNMSGTFVGAFAFNQPIGSWNTSSVRTFQGMFSIGFSGTYSFQQPVGTWNTSNATDISSMFANNIQQTGLSAWDIRKVVTANFFTPLMGTAGYDALLIAWAALADTDLSSQAITAFAASSANTLVTSNGHDLVAGSRVNISGTTSYNGDFNVVSVPNVNQFVIGTTFVADDATGTMKQRRSRNVTLGVGGLNQYSAGAAATARGVLVNTYGWTITDGGQV